MIEGPTNVYVLLLFYEPMKAFIPSKLLCSVLDCSFQLQEWGYNWLHTVIITSDHIFCMPRTIFLLRAALHIYVYCKENLN